jgi:small subunit ribosomal protein S3Ae
MARKMKGKEWYSIVAPQVFNEKVIGETPVGDPKTLLGRKIDVNAVNLLDDMSKYYLKFFFKIKKIEDKNAHTEFDGLECLRDYISRSIRYGIKKIDTIQDIETKDGKKIRVKGVTITSKKIKKNVAISLKKFVEDKIKKEIEKIDLDNFIEKVLNNSIKHSVMKEGSKIYPIRVFEIRKVEVK